MITYSEALLVRAEAWHNSALNEKRQGPGLAELAALYADITGEPAGSCRQCQFSDYSATVRAYVIQATNLLYPTIMAANTEYTLAPGFENETFVDAGYSKAVSAENLTDKDAKYFIGRGLGHAFYHNGRPVNAAQVAKLASAAESAPADGGEAQAEGRKVATGTTETTVAPAKAAKAGKRVRASRAAAEVASAPQIDGKELGADTAGPTA